MRKLQALICLTPIAVSACAMRPAAISPRAEGIASGPFVNQSASFTGALPPDGWWRLYDDPSLNSLVEEALLANTDLRVASANLQRAQAVLGEARTGHLPSTTVTGGVSNEASQRGDEEGSQSRRWSQTATLAVAWEADLFGQIHSAIRAAKADADAVEAVRDAVRITVAAETTRAYLNACAAGFELEAAHQSLDVSAKTHSLIDLQRQTGSADQLELERAASSLASLAATVPQIEGRRQFALFELAALLARAPAKVPHEALACMRPPDPLAAIPVGDGAALLKRRPDLRRAERTLAADAARVGVATADLYPRVSLGGTGSVFHNDFVRGSDSLSFSVGPLLSWNFPNVSVARARLRQARAQEDASLVAFDAAVITALKEVEQTLSTVSTQQLRVQALEEAQLRSERAFKLADLRYRTGSIGYLDLLSAQAELLSTRQAYATSVQQLASNRIDLFKALGGGWREAEIPLTS